MKKNVFEYAAVSACYAAALAAWTWPLAAFFLDHVPGHPNLSAYAHLWHYWWTRRALLDPGYALFFSPLLFYPWGVNTLVEFGNFLLPVASIPFQSLLGLAGAYNAVIFLFLPAGGAAAYGLCRRFAVSRPASFIGGALFLFLPYAWMEIFNGTAEIFTLFWLPLAFIALDTMLDKPGPLRGALMGAVVFLASMSSWYYGFFILLFAAAAAALTIASPAPAYETARPADRRRMLAAAAVMLAVCAIALGPFAVLMSGSPRVELDWAARAGDGSEMAAKSNPDILDLTGPWQKPDFGKFEGLDSQHPPFYPFAVFPGFLTVALAAFGFVGGRRMPRYYPLLFAVALAVFLGPWLKICGTTRFFGFRIPLPVFFLARSSDVFAANVMHSYRAAAALGALLIPPAAAGAEALFEALRLSPARQTAVAACALALAGAQGIDNARLRLPLARTNATVSNAFRAPALRDKTGAVINLPLSSATHVTHAYLFAQTAHNRPVLSGLAFKPHTYAEVNGFLQMLAKIQSGAEATAPNDAAGPDSLLKAGFRFFAVHWRLMPERGRQAVKELLEKHCDAIASDPDMEITIYEMRMPS